MVSLVKTPLLLEAQKRIAQLPRGGIATLAKRLGWSESRVRQLAKGMQPTGSRRPEIGPANQQIQRAVYELRRMTVGEQTMIEERAGVPKKELPALQDGQSWCCDNGCGETKPVVKQFEYSREEDRAGNLIESKTVPVWRSGCCGVGLFLHDRATETSTSWED